MLPEDSNLSDDFFSLHSFISSSFSNLDVNIVNILYLVEVEFSASTPNLILK